MMLMYTRAKDANYRDETNRVTRQADATLLNVPQAKTEKYKKSPICNGSAEWNKLSNTIRNSKERLGFKMRLKTFLRVGPNKTE